jgi:hypothetical protein
MLTAQLSDGPPRRVSPFDHVSAGEGFPFVPKLIDSVNDTLKRTKNHEVRNTVLYLT